MATRFQQLEIKDIRQETDSCVSVSFHIPPHLQPTFNFIQGQNITLKTVIDGEELRRSYSVCSSPLDNELRIAIKKVPQGKFSAWANSHLKKGDWLEVLPPSGKFYTRLDGSNKKHYIALVAGSGITPLLSIIKTTLATEPGSRFTLVYGNQTRASILFRVELEGLKNKYMHRFSLHHILSREKTDLAIYQGRITEEKCDAIFNYLVNLQSCHEFFVCGPGEMIFLLNSYLERKGIPKNKIHYELFSTPGKERLPTDNETDRKNTEPGKTSRVTLTADGHSFDFELPYNGKSILNAALALGVDLPFACKGGVCATCRARLLAGEVMMDNNYALEPEEIANGYVLSCQSHPRSEKLVIDFDG